jgi:quercetin dioxygenase-like cupin family protein
MPKIDFDALQLAEVPAYSEATALAKYTGGYPDDEMVRVVWKPGHKAHPHTHQESVYWYVLSGRVAVTLGDEEFEVTAGQGWHTPGGMVHTEEFLEDTVGVVFKSKGSFKKPGQ